MSRSGIKWLPRWIRIDRMARHGRGEGPVHAKGVEAESGCCCCRTGLWTSQGIELSMGKLLNVVVSREYRGAD